MTRSHLAIIVVLLLTPCVKAWEPVAPLPQPAAGFAAACIDNHILVAGGTNWVNDVKQWLKTTWRYDTQRNQWTIGPELPYPVAYAASASDGKKLIVAGGADNETIHTQVLAIDSKLRFETLSPLPNGTVFAAGAWVGDHLHLIAGTRSTSDWSTAHVSHISHDGKSFAPVPATGLALMATAVLGQQIYTFTGARQDSAGVVVNTNLALQYNPAQDTWRTLPPYPLTARGVAAVAIDATHIYLGGGYTNENDSFIDKAWIFDTASSKFSPAPPLPFAALTHLVRCGDFVYCLGGEDVKKHRTDKCFRLRITDLLKTP